MTARFVLIFFVCGFNRLAAQEEAAEPASGRTSAIQQADSGQVRKLAEIHQELRQLERGMAKAKTDGQKSENTVAMCRLFVEIGEHPQLPKSPTLQSLSVRLRTRLSNLEDRVVKELRRRKIPQPEHMEQEERDERKARAVRTQAALASRDGRRPPKSVLAESGCAGGTGFIQSPPRPTARLRPEDWTR